MPTTDRVSEEAALTAQAPCGINHLVLNVGDIEESHRFWTEILGFTPVGTVPHGEGRPSRSAMRFYSGDHDGHLTHHDIALVETCADEDATRPAAQRLNHVAIALPNEEAWRRQLRFLEARGIAVSRRVDRRMTRSFDVMDPNGVRVEILYELPRENWAADIEAALNHATQPPANGAAARR